jgi:hypothetical protein
MNRSARLLAFAACFASAVAPLAAHAQPAPSTPVTRAAKQEAATRFRKGLDLYNDGDFQAALIEFRRAYELAPSYQVLYNIGQVYFQLQDYAGALSSLERYLAEGGAGVPPSRRADVEKDIAKLRARVAHIEVTTNVPDVEITLDDVSIGKTPFPKPILVSAGRHKLTAAKPGYKEANRVIELASGDSPKLAFDLADLSAAPPPAPEPAHEAPPPARAPEPASASSHVWIGWAVTGGLAVGAGVFGGLALAASGDLSTKRQTAGTTRDALDAAQSKTKTLALVSDVFTASTLVAGGVSLYFTLKGPSSAKPKTEAADVRLGVRPGGLALSGSF